jgi:hypothetical protein
LGSTRVGRAMRLPGLVEGVGVSLFGDCGGRGRGETMTSKLERRGIWKLLKEMIWTCKVRQLMKYVKSGYMHVARY